MANVYRPLEGDEVRFVRIRPGAWSDPIQCELDYLPLPNAEVDVVEAWFSGKPLPKLLNQNLYDPRPFNTTSSTGSSGEASTETTPTTKTPPFVALSSAWGDPNHTEELLLDGQPVQKTVNLIAGLRQLRALLRNPSRSLGVFLDHHVLFWMDALCINQTDDTEKSMQVPRMGAIYGAAKLVVVCLGENGEDDNEIQELMSLVNRGKSEGQPWSPEDRSSTINALDSTKIWLRTRRTPSSIFFCRCLILDSLCTSSIYVF